MPKLKLGVHSKAGRLHKVMVCSPGLAHQRLTPGNCNELLFDDVLWVAQAKRDHFAFVSKMRERNIDVLEMHNLLTDIAVSVEKPSRCSEIFSDTQASFCHHSPTLSLPATPPAGSTVA